MRLAIAESLKPQKFQCQWCKMMLDTREELDLHRYNDCSEIGPSLQPSEPQADESPQVPGEAQNIEHENGVESGAGKVLPSINQEDAIGEVQPIEPEIIRPKRNTKNTAKMMELKSQEEAKRSQKSNEQKVKKYVSATPSTRKQTL